MAHRSSQIQYDFGRNAHRYDEYAQIQQRVLHAALEQITPQLKANDTVLDVGCGTGAALPMLQDQGFPGDVYGVDLAFPMVELAHERRVLSAQANAASLPFPDGQFDAVMSVSVLQWSEDLETSLKELVRVVKPGGKMFVSLFGAESLSEFRECCAAVGYDAPLMTLPSKQEWETTIQSICHDAEVRSEIYSQPYLDIRHLMRSMSHIGAGLKGEKSPRYLPKQMLQDMQHYYARHHACENGVAASWQNLSALISIK